MTIHSYRAGQTLIEVIIAIGLLMMVLTTLVAGLAVGVRNNRIAKDQAAAKDYTRESMEWFRAVRDANGWDAFAQTLYEKSSGGTLLLCLSSLPQTLEELAGFPEGGCMADVSKTVDGKFWRELTITLTGGADPVHVQTAVVVSWNEGTRVLKNTSQLSLYEWK